MRNLVAATLAVSLLTSSAFAATLAPGKPAGVKAAQMEGSGLMWGLGLAVVIGGALAVGSGNGKSTITTTTTSTNP
jgi:hypothetical protein